MVSFFIKKYRRAQKNVSRSMDRNLWVQLLLSISFFDLCIRNDAETLYAKAHDIYCFSKGFGDDRLIQVYSNNVYAKLINRIFKNSNFLLNVWSKHMPNLLKTSVIQIQQNIVKCIYGRVSIYKNVGILHYNFEIQYQ